MRRLAVWSATFAAIALVAFMGRPGPSRVGEAEDDVARPEADVFRSTGEVLVDLDDSWSEADVEMLEVRLGIDLRLNSRYSDDANLYRTVAPANVVHALGREEGVEAVEVEGAWEMLGEDIPDDRTHMKPDDPHYANQWHMRQIRMPRGWKLARGRTAVVAVIDTGVAYEDHGEFKRVPDLAETAFVPGFDFVDDDAHPNDEHGHGTHVAGTIAQSTNNGIGVTGVAPGAAIMPIRVLDKNGMGTWADIADGIRFAADHGADVINMSLGGAFGSRIVERAVDHAHAKGVVIVCAAGNSGRRGVGYPARYDHSIAVAATRFDETTTFYSTWGPQVDIAAPGGDVRVDQNGDGMPDGVLQNTILAEDPSRNDYLAWMGTSMATPHVAGAAALLVSAGVTDPDGVESILEGTARGEGRDRQRYGAGILDVERALGKTQMAFGLWGLALAAVLTWFVRRGKGESTVKVRVGWVLGAFVAATGPFFLPALVGGDLDWVWMVSRPLLAWDQVLLGAGGHGNPIVYSAIVPVAAAAVGYGVPRLRGLLAGLSVGIAASLLFVALFGTVEVLWMPWVLAKAWLFANAGASALLARAML